MKQFFASDLVDKIQKTLTDQQHRETDPQKNPKVILAHRDHAVVKDFTSPKGYKVISLDELKKKHPHKTKIFVATKSECQKWVDAPDMQARKEVENWAEARHRKRVPLPSEIDNDGKELKDQVMKIADKFKLSVQTTLFGSNENHSQNKNLEL